MSLTKLTENLNIISSLPDRPTETSEELKSKFDKAGNIIKEYIDEVLTVEIEKLIMNTVNASKTIVENVLTSESAVNALSAGQGNVLNELINNVKTGLESKINGTTLYENSTGTTENITLNKDKSNFSIIKICGYFKREDVVSKFCRDFIIDEMNNYEISGVVRNGSARTYIVSEILTINESSLIRDTQFELGIADDSIASTIRTTGKFIYITKIIGYE